MSGLKFDVTGGLPPAQDLVLAQVPSNPLYREGANIWLYDDQGRFAFPRFGVEAVAASWDNRGGQGNIAFPDGRVLLAQVGGAAVGPFDEEGRPTVIGAGAVKFQCIKPFEHWRVTYDGMATDTTVAGQVAGTVDPSRQASVRLDADLYMAVPPVRRQHQ